MILKGNLHNDGGFLASYLAKADKDDERATLAELRGFGSSNIFDAMRDVQLEAEVTRAEKPLFHAQGRLRRGERLTDQQWIEAADRAERALGFTGQPRVIVFHDSPETGERHAHFVWSRIDREELHAIDPGLYKRKLMEVQKGIERDFELEPTQKLAHAQDKTAAPKRDEYEQSRRLGTDIKDLRENIRECWERTDSGKAFGAALSERDLTLAQGDRRDFVVIDQAGGLHALGKRILGVPAAEIRSRLSDLERAQLPTVEQARAALSRDRPTETGFAAGAAQVTQQVTQPTPSTEADRQRPSTEQQPRVDDVADAKARYERAYQENYKPADPYASLAQVAVVENSMFQQEQRELDRQIAGEANPEQRRRLALRKEIEGCDYMALTSERIAQQSDAIGTRNAEADAVRQREKGRFYQERGRMLREERDLTTEQRLQRLQASSETPREPERGPSLER